MHVANDGEWYLLAFQKFVIKLSIVVKFSILPHFNVLLHLMGMFVSSCTKFG